MSVGQDPVAVKSWLAPVNDARRTIVRYGSSLQVFEWPSDEIAALAADVLLCLDGTRTRAQIVEELAAPSQAVHKLLEVFQAHGLLDAIESREVCDEARVIAAATAGDVTEVAGTLARASVAIIGNGHLVSLVEELLDEAGFGFLQRLGWHDVPTDCDLVVVAPSPAELPELRGWNGRALANETRWLQALPFDGKRALFGPLFIPFATCCHECFSIRLRSMSDYPDELRIIDRAPAAYPASSVADSIGAGLVLAIVERCILGIDTIRPPTYFSVETFPVEVSQHTCWRVPRCPACGPTGYSMPWIDLQ